MSLISKEELNMYLKLSYLNQRGLKGHNSEGEACDYITWEVIRPASDKL